MALLVLTSLAQAAPPALDWPMWGQNPAHTGVQPAGQGNLRDSAVVKWSWDGSTGNAGRAPTVADIDNDGLNEIVVTYQNDPYVYAFNGEDGTLLWSTPLTPFAMSAPAIGDIDNDGKQEVVVSQAGSIVALNGEDGSLLWESDTFSAIGPPIIVDLEGDGAVEIVMVGSWSVIYTAAYNGIDGSVKWKYPLGNLGPIYIAAGNMRGDSILEIAVAPALPADSILILDNDGNLLQRYGWDYLTWFDVTTNLALSDLDGDGYDDIVFGTFASWVVALSDALGTFLWSYDAGRAEWFQHIAVGNVDYDPQPEVLASYSKGNSGDLYILEGESGTYKTRIWTGINAAIGNIDDDSLNEIVCLSATANMIGAFELNPSDSVIFQWTADAFPNFYPVIADVDGDSSVEIVGVFAGPWLTVWDDLPLGVPEWAAQRPIVLKVWYEGSSLHLRFTLPVRKEAKVELYDVKGSLVAEHHLLPGRSSYSLKAPERKGVYFLLVKGGGIGTAKAKVAVF